MNAPTVNSLSLDQWLAEFDRLKKVNAQIMATGKMKRKRLGARTARVLSFLVRDIKFRPMTPLFSKLNVKGQGALTVLNSPGSFEEELTAPKGVEIRRDGTRETPFLLAFVTTLKDVAAAAKVAKTKTSGDAVVWMAYPKGTSKNYKCDSNRDTGWSALGAARFEPVRMIAIDEDWSAIRFRRVDFITSILSEKGKARAKKGEK